MLRETLIGSGIRIPIATSYPSITRGNVASDRLAMIGVSGAGEEIRARLLVG